MLKNIGYQIEAFNGYRDATEEVGDQMREVCFDKQNLLIEFFTNAVRCVRRECQDEQRGLCPSIFAAILTAPLAKGPNFREEEI